MSNGIPTIGLYKLEKRRLNRSNESGSPNYIFDVVEKGCFVRVGHEETKISFNRAATVVDKDLAEIVGQYSRLEVHAATNVVLDLANELKITYAALSDQFISELMCSYQKR